MDAKILIVDDVATNRIVFKVKLGAASYSPVMASGGHECLRLAHTEAPDLILLDLMLPDLPGVDVLCRLRADPVTRHIPVIVVSASTDPADRLMALEAGADDIFIKPYDDQRLMARVRNLLRSQQEVSELNEGNEVMLMGMAEAAAEFAPPGVLALVTDRPDVALRLRRDLAPLMRDTFVIMGLADALLDIEPGRPAADLYIIDADDTRGPRGLRLVSDLRSRAATRHAGICLLSGPAVTGANAMGFDLGANEVFEPGITTKEIALRLRRVLARKRRADTARAQLQNGLRMAMIDPLTGLFNRRYAMARLAALSESAHAKGRSFAVMIADLDRFKSVNDRFGHAAGDAVLVEVSRRLAANLRADDLLARVGGEEFLIVLPDTSMEEARNIAQRLCAQIEARPVQLPKGEVLNVTVSIGLALSDGAASALLAAGDPGQGARVMEDADQALMMSKSSGRNTVTLWRNAA
jgi:two-component system cell cycle response regulator